MSKKKILIADDEPSILNLLEITLGDTFDLMLAKDGREVMDLIAKDMPDLLLLDVMMPYMNGYEVCKKIKSDANTSSLRIAMLSAKGQEEDIMKGLDLGADHYFTKPFDPIGLELRIKEILEEK